MNHFPCVFDHVIKTFVAMSVQSASLIWETSKIEGLGLGLSWMGNRCSRTYSLFLALENRLGEQHQPPAGQEEEGG